MRFVSLDGTLHVGMRARLAGFEGASLAQVSQGKIISLREYAMTAPRYEWEGRLRRRHDVS